MPTNALLCRWSGGWIWQYAQTSHTPPIDEALLGTAAHSISEVASVAQGEFTRIGHKRDQVTVGYEPPDFGEDPYVAFGIGDTVTAPNRLFDGTSVQVVSGISGSWGRDTERLDDIEWRVQVGDLVAERDEQVAKQLEKLSAGARAGDSPVAQPVDFRPVPTPQVVADVGPTG